MSLETKIRELMEQKKAKALNEAAAGKSDDGEGMNSHMQGDSQKPTYTEVDPFSGQAVVKTDDSIKKPAGEASNPKQGDSKDADVNQVDPHSQNTTTPDSSLKKGNSEPQARQGNSRDAAVKTAAGKGHGSDTYELPTNPGEGQIPFKEDTVSEDDVITEEDIEEDIEPRKVEMNLEDLRKDIASVFSADANLSEEFKTQASAIFEAAVISRVNNEIEKITEELVEQAADEIEKIKDDLVDKVDSYLGYVVEQWMKDNEVAVEKGLRTEVAEDFMLGLKNLFQEHYFEVPEDKVDVLEDMAVKVDEAESKLDEAIATNIELKTQLEAVMRERIVEQACRGLTATEAEKLGKLLEGVEYDNEELYTQKVKVVKENYFPAGTPNSPEKMLEEEVQHGDKPAADVPAHIQRYVQTLSRSVKK
jgi:hypothetical protein